MNKLWLILIILMFIAIFNLTLLPHPIYMVIFMLMYSIFLCLIMAINSTTMIFPILIFLITISGLLIIFMYFTSLISNTQIPPINSKINYFILILNMIMFIMLMYLYFCPNLNLMKLLNFYNKIYLPPFTPETSPMLNLNKMIETPIMKLYQYPTNNLTMLCMFLLLFTLFLIIKMCNLKSAPLRKL